MGILSENVIKRRVLSALTPVLPYGVAESWDDLNPRLYLALHVYWLKFYGMWYNNFSPKQILFWIQLVYTLIVFWLLCLFPSIGEVIYLLRRKEKNFGDIVEGLYLFLTEIYAFFKLAVFWWNKDKIMELLEYLHCEEFKPIESEHKDIVRRSIKRARLIITAFGTIVTCSIWGICFKLLYFKHLDHKHLLIDSLITADRDEWKAKTFWADPKYRIFKGYFDSGFISFLVGIIMPISENFEILPTNVEYPYFDVYKSPAYEIIYIHQIYYKPASCIISVIMDTILAAFVSSAIGQVEILAFNLRHLDTVADRRRERASNQNGRDENATQDYYIRTVLRDCIIHHNSIIRYVSTIESAFSLASALQFIFSITVLCLVGLQFLSIEEPTSHLLQIIWMVGYLTCLLIQVFILCWFGDELIWKSTELSRAAYDGPWRSLSKNNSLILIILLERCNRPLQLTAGKIFTLSLDNYTNLIKGAYNAFAVMRNMKK